MSDFLTITEDNAPQPEKKVYDPRFWKPTIKNKAKEYHALVRMLPRGRDGIKNRLEPTVKLLKHRLVDKKSKVFMEPILCPKTLDPWAACPICDAAWGIFNEGKKNNNKSLQDVGKSRLPQESHLVNIYLREDYTDKENTGLVKIWEHTPAVNRELLLPTKDEPVDPSKPNQKKKKKYYPYCPKTGRDREVIVTENPENQMATYSASKWEADEDTEAAIYRPLAETDDEIYAILDKCYDLSEFTKVIPTGEELANHYSKFLDKINASANSSAMSGGSTPVSRGEGNSAPSTKAPATNSGESFFGDNKKPSQPAPAKKDELVMDVVDEPELGEDDLPF